MKVTCQTLDCTVPEDCAGQCAAACARCDCCAQGEQPATEDGPDCVCGCHHDGCKPVVEKEYMGDPPQGGWQYWIEGDWCNRDDCPKVEGL